VFTRPVECLRVMAEQRQAAKEDERRDGAKGGTHKLDNAVWLDPRELFHGAAVLSGPRARRWGGGGYCEVEEQSAPLIHSPFTAHQDVHIRQAIGVVQLHVQMCQNIRCVALRGRTDEASKLQMHVGAHSAHSVRERGGGVG
jgi:hypothetical protein